MRRLVQHAKQEETRAALVRVGATEWTVSWLRRFGNDQENGTNGAKLDAMRLLRNLCVDNEQAKVVMERLGAAQVVRDAHVPTQVDQCKIAMQVLCNYTLEFRRGQDQVWSVWFPNQFSRTIETSGDPKVAAMAARTILHCVKESRAWTGELANTESGKKLMAEILQLTCKSFYDGKERASLEELLAHLCLRRGFYVELFRTVECPSGRAQLTSIFSQCVAERREERNSEIIYQGLAALVKESLEGAARACRQEGTCAESLRNPEELTGTPLLLYHLLGLLRELTQVELHQKSIGAEEDDVVQQIHRAGVLKVLVEMLGSLGVPNPFKLQKGLSEEQLKNISSPESSSVFPTQSPYIGYRTDIVAALSNMCFRRPYCQEEVLALGGVDMVLSNCQVEGANPLLREWSLVCIRNLCEQSESVRQHIASLQLLDAERHPELEDLGLRVEIGSEGKPVVRRYDAATGHPLHQQGWTPE